MDDSFLLARLHGGYYVCRLCHSMLEVSSVCYTVSTSTTFGAAYLEELELEKGKTLLESRMKTRLSGERWYQYVACEIPSLKLREGVLWVFPLHVCLCCFELRKSEANHQLWQLG